MSELEIKWPDGFNWWAMDKNGVKLFWGRKPIIDDDGFWVSENGKHIDDENPPDTIGLDWKDSLRQNQSGSTGLDLSHLIPKAHVPNLRDQFAMAALTGMLANPKHKLTFTPEDDAAYVFNIVDAMLKHREESK